MGGGPNRSRKSRRQNISSSQQHQMTQKLERGEKRRKGYKTDPHRDDVVVVDDDDDDDDDIVIVHSNVNVVSGEMLPENTVAEVMKYLDVETLASACQVNQLWRRAGESPNLWRELCRRHHFVGDEDVTRFTSPRMNHWKHMFINHIKELCFQCSQPTSRRTVRVGTNLSLALCQQCHDSMTSWSPSHRLLSTSEAKYRYVLKDEQIRSLPFAVDSNPVDSRFATMRIHRRYDVEQLAIQVHGSRKLIQKAFRRKLLR